MKLFKIILLVSAIAGVSTTASSCRKKEKGNCYCTYASGDRTHYNLTSLSRGAQQDSCNVLDGNAQGFGGDCKLK